MTDTTWRGTILEPAEFHMLNDKIGDMILSRDLWESLGSPGHMGQFEYGGHVWLCGGMARYGMDRLKLRVRKVA